MHGGGGLPEEVQVRFSPADSYATDAPSEVPFDCSASLHEREEGSKEDECFFLRVFSLYISSLPYCSSLLGHHE